MNENNNRPTDLKNIKQMIKSGDFESAFECLRSIARPEHDFSLQHRYATLYEIIPKGNLGLKPVRVAFTATATLEHFIGIFRFWCALDGFDAQVFLAEFNTVHQSILSPESELYAFKPDIVWLFTGNRDVNINVIPGETGENIAHEIESAVDTFTAMRAAVRQHSSAFVIQNNADLPDVRMFGNFEGMAVWGRQNLLRAFNVELARTVSPGAAIFDIDYLSSYYGKSAWFDARYWYHSKHPFALNASGLVAFSAARLVGAIKGWSKKCMVLDLDNTLWGGVIGDDGLEGIRIGTGADGEAFADFQSYLKGLSSSGIILAICSKNEEENAKLPFLQHPDMLLKLDDFAVFKANWNNKADNIREIAEELNIGLDSIVFIDDSPFERNLVKSILPMVTVPDMPEDPALFIQTINAQRLFEIVSLSDEDKKRGEMYRGNVERTNLQKKFEHLDDYLADLNMESFAGDFDSANLPRIAQLINKSNQFHLTTTRYPESAILDFMNDGSYICRYYRLKDRFGDNGLIALVIMKKEDSETLCVDTWVMSCRVLSRGMEEFIHADMVDIARKRGCRRIAGKYIPTRKNKLVEMLYSKLGYAKSKEENGTTLWECAINDNTPLFKHFIKRADSR